MAPKLEEVFALLEKLPEQEQDGIAELLLSELAWRKSFSTSQKELEHLAEEALQEFRRKK
jgi:hypothetical protein